MDSVGTIIATATVVGLGAVAANLIVRLIWSEAARPPKPTRPLWQRLLLALVLSGLILGVGIPLARVAAHLPHPERFK
jgi:hypothetical protein